MKKALLLLGIVFSFIGLNVQAGRDRSKSFLMSQKTSDAPVTNFLKEKGLTKKGQKAFLGAIGNSLSTGKKSDSLEKIKSNKKK